MGVVGSKRNEKRVSLTHSDARGINFQPSETKLTSELLKLDSSPPKEKQQETVLPPSKEVSSVTQLKSEPSEVGLQSCILQ